MSLTTLARHTLGQIHERCAGEPVLTAGALADEARRPSPRLGFATCKPGCVQYGTGLAVHLATFVPNVGNFAISAPSIRQSRLAQQLRCPSERTVVFGE